MKVNWFSPLPPQPSGIADFTAQLLPYLGAEAELTVWTNRTGWDRDLERHAVIRAIDTEWLSDTFSDGNALNIYQIGNDGESHSTIWQLSRQYPGMVVLHDISLQNLFWSHFCCEQENRQAYLRAVAKFHGKVGIQSAVAMMDLRLTFDHVRNCFPLTELAVERAQGVVVHTYKGQRALQRFSGLPLLSMQLPYPSSNHGAQRAQEGDWERDDAAPFQLIMFGHLGANRCIGQILEALARFPRRDQYHLNIFGTLRIPKKDVRRDIEKWGLKDQVTLHGPVSESVLESALSQSDLALNLRYPTMGEASHSQLRIWDHSLPSVVTRVGWYAGLPTDTVAVVRPGQEVSDLQHHLLGFLADRDRYLRLGEKGNQWLRLRHNPRTYVARLLQFAAEVHARRKIASPQDRPRVSGWSSVSLREHLHGFVEDKVTDWCPEAVKQYMHAKMVKIMKSLEGRHQSHQAAERNEHASSARGRNPQPQEVPGNRRDNRRPRPGAARSDELSQCAGGS